MIKKRESGYQKLKRRVAELEADIHTLVRKSDTPDGILCRKKYEIKFDTEKLVWSGSRTVIIKQDDTTI